MTNPNVNNNWIDFYLFDLGHLMPAKRSSAVFKIVIAQKPIIFFQLVIWSLFAPQLTVQAQNQSGKPEKHQNVFLHPKLFYKKYFPHLKIKSDPPDSTFIKVYPDYLSVSAHVLRPSIGLDIASRSSDNGKVKYRTNIGDIFGFTTTYKFVGAGFAFLVNSGPHSEQGYTKSRYRTATIKYNSKGWSLQYKYLRFKGLTDIGTNGMDPSISFIKRPDIVNKEFQFEGLYNPGWRKYSYIAPLTFSQRQVKSRRGFLLKTGVYYSQLSGDTSLVDPIKSKYYGAFNGIKAIRTLSIRVAPGVGGNLVFLRKYYFSIAAFPSYDLYLYKYLTNVDDKVKGKQTFIFVLDGKTSFGYQSKRMYGGLRFEFERRSAALSAIDMNTMYTYLGVELGYRFTTPKIVKKVYKQTMPPGM